MYELINHYRGLSEKQRQDVKLQQNYHVIEQERLEKMEEEIKQANIRRLKEEKLFEESIVNQAQKIQDKEYEVKLIQLRLKEKDKELRLCELKSKEYKRQIRHNSLKPISLDTGHSLKALISPRYEPFYGAKMRYQQARNYYVSKKVKKKEVNKSVEELPVIKNKQKVIEYVEPEKDYVHENIRRLKESKKKGKKKIGGIVIDEANFKAMLKQFNNSVPK